MAQVATAEIKLSLNTKDYNQALRGATAGLKNLSTANYGVTIDNRDADLALQTTLGFARQLGGALKSIGQQAVGEFRAFSGALQGTAAISGASAEEIAKLKEEAIALGIQTTKSPTQVAQAATAYTRLGFSAAEATEDLGGLVQLSESTGSSLESSAQVTATASKLFGDSVDAITAANVITASTTNTAVSSVDEFNQVLSKAGGIAKSNDVSFSELAATFGLLRTSGSSAEVAATAVKNSLTRLLVPTGAGKKAISELGLQVRDSSGNFVGLRTVLENLRNSVGGLNNEARDTNLKDIFGTFAGPAITSLLALDPNEFNRVFDAIEQSSEGAGVAAGVADKRLQGLNKTLTLLEGTTQTTKAAIGEQLAPAFNVAAKSVLSTLNVFLGLPAPLQKVVVGVGALTSGAAALTIALSSLRSAQASDTLARVGLSAGALKETFSGLTATATNLAGNLATSIGKIPALPSIKLPAPKLDVETAQQNLLVAAAEKSSAAQVEAVRRVAEEKAKASVASAISLEQESRSNLALLKTQEGIKATAIANAEAKTRSAVASRIAAEANLKEASASRVAAAADLQEKTSTELAAAADLKKATTTKAEAVATALSSAKQKINAAVTTAAAFVKDVYAVATGKAAAAEKSAAVAAAASAAQLAILAGAALVVVENLRVLGVVGNESAKKVREFKKALKEETNAPITKEDIGLIDQLRVGFDQLTNILPGRNRTEEESINQVTSAAQDRNQELKASADLQEQLIALAQKDQAAIVRRNEAYKEEETISKLTNAQRAARISLLETELEGKQKEIDAARATGLEAEAQIGVLENQAGLIKESIALLEGKEVITREQAIANDLQKKSVEELTAAQSASNNETDLAIAKIKALANEQLAAGTITESQAQSQIADAEKAALQERLDDNKAFLSKLRALETEGSGSAEAAAELQQQILDAEQEGLSLRSDLARSAIDEQKRISEEALSALEESEAERRAKAVQATAQTRNAILTEQLNGVIDAQTAQERIGQAELDSIKSRITNQKQALQDLQGTQGIGSEERIAKEQEINAEILSLENDLLSKQISLQESSTAARIKAVKDRLGKQAAAVKAGLKKQEATLKASLAKREISEEEYQQSISALKQEGTQSRIDQLKQEEQAIQDLATQGLITQEEAQMQLMAIQESVASESIKLADEQISQQKALAEEIRNRAAIEQESARLTLDLQNQALEGQKQSLSFQGELASAQQALGEAQTNLAVQRLKFAQEDATTLQESLAIGRQIFEAEKAGTLAKLKTEKKVLEVKIAQQKIDNEIASARAQIAVTEAQAALEAAKARDASAGELQNLEKILELKQGIVSQTEESAAAQEELFGIQRRNLSVNQEIAQEALARKEQLFNRDQEKSAIQSIGSSSVSRLDQQQSDRILSGLGRRTFADSGAEAEAIARVAFGNLDNEALTGELQGLGGFASEIGRLAEELRSAGISESEGRSLASKVDGDSGTEVVTILRELVAATKENSRPNVSVSTANPLSDTLDILRNR